MLLYSEVTIGSTVLLCSMGCVVNEAAPLARDVLLYVVVGTEESMMHCM